MILILSFFLAAAGMAWGADTSPTLEIRVVEGDGAVYAAGSRATGGVTVLVSDGDGRPVEGATVSFTLPSSGPGGVFATGKRTEVAVTHADGRAAAWGMQWNRTAGPFAIRITAVKGQARAAAASSQSLAPADKAAGATVSRGGGSHKILWISLAVAGAAVAGVAGAGIGKSSSGAAATTSSTATTQIGAPTISLGHP